MKVKLYINYYVRYYKLLGLLANSFMAYNPEIEDR